MRTLIANTGIVQVNRIADEWSARATKVTGLSDGTTEIVCHDLYSDEIIRQQLSVAGVGWWRP